METQMHSCSDMQ